jgi:hypothetical protein
MEAERLMEIAFSPDLLEIIEEQARQRGSTPEAVVIDTLRDHLAPFGQAQPRDDWERMLMQLGRPAGLSLPDKATTRESLYD